MLSFSLVDIVACYTFCYKKNTHTHSVSFVCFFCTSRSLPCDSRLGLSTKLGCITYIFMSISIKKFSKKVVATARPLATLSRFPFLPHSLCSRVPPSRNPVLCPQATSPTVFRASALPLVTRQVQTEYTTRLTQTQTQTTPPPCSCLFVCFVLFCFVLFCFVLFA